MSDPTKSYPKFHMMWDNWLIGRRFSKLLKLLHIVLDELLWGSGWLEAGWDLFGCFKVHQKVLVW